MRIAKLLLVLVLLATSASALAGKKKYRLRVNNQVLYGDEIRRVEALDDGSRVVLRREDRSERVFTTRQKVSKIVRCYKGVCRGREVLHKNSIRTVQAVDNTGRVVLQAVKKYTDFKKWCSDAHYVIADEWCAYDGNDYYLDYDSNYKSWYELYGYEILLHTTFTLRSEVSLIK